MPLPYCISRRVLRFALAVLTSLYGTTNAFSQPDLEAFDGSFRLQTGEVITGGYFVENAQGRYLYMDTEHLEKGELFERVNETGLRSVVPPGAVEVEFVASADGGFDTLVWREQGHEPVRGERVYPHTTRALQVISEDGTRLEGRLLVPECAGPHPVVVAVHGSGPVNRYGGPYHTFFLKHGIAVLAYDKRGYTTNSDAWREPDLTALATDAAAAVRFAAAQPDVDSDRIGIFGSSQAGWVVPRAAVDAPETDFIILRAGAALSGAETVLHEVRQELRSDGLDGLDLDYAMDLRRELYVLAMSRKPIAAADSLVAPYLDTPWYRAAFGDGPISGQWSTRWWEWAGRNLAIAAPPSLEQFEGPVLWFLAELDENVPLVPTRAALERAFAAAPGDDHEVVVLEDARHSFLLANPEGPPQFSDGFFSHMGAWMDRHGFSDATCWDGDG